jgi:hypothetical protein
MTEKAAEESVETIIELVEHTPLWAILLAAAIGGGLVFFVMLTLSKAPTTTE